LNMAEMVQQASQDSGFIPEITFLGYFANFMVQNTKVTIEVIVYPDTIEKITLLPNLTQERAETIVKYLKKEKIKKDRMTAIGYMILPEEEEVSLEKIGKIEIKILTK